MNSSKKITGNYVLLSTGENKIIIPQSELGQAHYLPDGIKWQRTSIHGGVFSSTQIKDKVFVGLSDDLSLITETFDDRLTVLTLNRFKKLNDIKLYWTWKSAKVLIDVEYNLIELPSFAIKENTPISEYVVHNGEVVYHCNVDKLIEYFLGETNL